MFLLLSHVGGSNSRYLMLDLVCGFSSFPLFASINTFWFLFLLWQVHFLNCGVCVSKLLQQQQREHSEVEDMPWIHVWTFPLYYPLTHRGAPPHPPSQRLCCNVALSLSQRLLTCWTEHQIPFRELKTSNVPIMACPFLMTVWIYFEVAVSQGINAEWRVPEKLNMELRSLSCRVSSCQSVKDFG